MTVSEVIREFITPDADNFGFWTTTDRTGSSRTPRMRYVVQSNNLADLLVLAAEEDPEWAFLDYYPHPHGGRFSVDLRRLDWPALA